MHQNGQTIKAQCGLFTHHASRWASKASHLGHPAGWWASRSCQWLGCHFDPPVESPAPQSTGSSHPSAGTPEPRGAGSSWIMDLPNTNSPYPSCLNIVNLSTYEFTQLSTTMVAVTIKWHHRAWPMKSLCVMASKSATTKVTCTVARCLRRPRAMWKLVGADVDGDQGDKKWSMW